MTPSNSHFAVWTSPALSVQVPLNCTGTFTGNTFAAAVGPVMVTTGTGLARTVRVPFVKAN
jgi:hypothetical protein